LPAQVITATKTRSANGYVPNAWHLSSSDIPITSSTATVGEIASAITTSNAKAQIMDQTMRSMTQTS
jgi:hypothetical protein